MAETYRHVETGAGESARVGVDELARNAKVAEFDHAFARQEHVRRLDVPVYCLLGVQVRQTRQDLHRHDRTSATHQLSQNGTYALRDTSSDLLPNARADQSHLLANRLEAAALAELHEDLDLARRRGHVRSIELDDVYVGCGRADSDLSQELLHWRLERGDCLSRHDRACPFVPHLVNCAASSLAEPGQFLEDIIGVLIKFLHRLAQILHRDDGGRPLLR